MKVSAKVWIKSLHRMVVLVLGTDPRSFEQVTGYGRTEFTV